MSNSADENEGQRTGPGDDPRDIVHSPHDRLLSRALANKESAQELIRSHLPAEISSCLKLETIEQADTSFIDANLKRRFADRLFKIELTEEVAEELGVECPYVHLLVLIDHKSTSDKYTVIQMLGYIVRIWEHSIENHSPLLPIIPWVLYNGMKPWTVPRSLAELIPTLESWKRYMLGMEIPIFDIGREEDSEMSGELILQMTLVLLKYGREKELAEKLRLVLQSISEQLEGYRVGMLVDTIRKYVMSVNPEVGQKELQSIFDDFWPVQHEPGSVADQLISKGREEGRQEGEIKLIRILESILGIESGATDLSKKSLEELRCITESLQAQVKKRGN